MAQKNWAPDRRLQDCAAMFKTQLHWTTQCWKRVKDIKDDCMAEKNSLPHTLPCSTALEMTVPNTTSLGDTGKLKNV